MNSLTKSASPSVSSVVAMMFAGLTSCIVAIGAVGTGELAAQSVVITNAEIHPVSGPVIPSGTLVISDGRIAAVGADVSVPEGARVIDGSGKVVTPGFLDSFTQLGIVEIGAVSGTNDIFSEDDRITAAFDVVYGLNPASSLIPIARTGGITRAVIAPSPGASIIAGQGALIDLGGERVQDMLHRRSVAMFGILNESAAERAGGARGTAMLRIREALQDASDYAANRQAYAAGGRREYAMSRLDLEALVPVARGQVPFALAVDRAADILSAIELAEEFGLRLILISAAEGWLVADDIARAGIPVVLNPMHNIPSYDALSATLENATRLSAAGVEVTFATFDAHNVRNLRQAAGNAVAYGMPRDAALRAITSAPAALWGISDSYGRLEVGMDADVVVWSGDPFEPLTALEHVFIEGRELRGDTRQELLVERYRNLNERLPEAYQP